ncbi:MAG: DUF1810 family protein [Pirellulales bacterium]|nr:DUF1810 family protein [Pirellulales bacterium]
MPRAPRAQAKVYDVVLQELRAGRKNTLDLIQFLHIEGLGHNEMAIRYAIQDRGEAGDYIHHPQLAERLGERTQMLIDSRAASARDILGTPDDRKLRFSMTLSQSALNAPRSVFTDVLDFFFNSRCKRTLDCLSNT